MHPPFGIALYNLRNVAPQTVATSQIYWGAVPFLAIQLIMVVILIAVPSIEKSSATADGDIDDIKIEPPPIEECDAALPDAGERR